MRREPATMSLIDDATKLELTAMYNAAGRFYHTRAHVDSLLALLEKHREVFHDAEAVEAAVWFHDAIYDSRAKDNEAKSAELAAERLAPSVGEQRLSRIRAMIEATTTHSVPEVSDPRHRADLEMFLDMDLSVLAAEPDVFDAYEAAVREEYSWADEGAWRAGRAAVLRSFLDRPTLFFSELFRRQFEAAARENLRRSLARLGA